ncbi:hypothetical protein [Streptomyces sp. Je 1-369]|nr:hypothetical protein [Streptomyces sp. Je 1-369]WAL93466.1 hypothetical protein NOO62_02575 [Streptomyces sp. Je 1-369]
MAGQPVHQEWIDRAHHLFDTHNTEAASPALATAFDVLVDELPHPQH